MHTAQATTTADFLKWDKKAQISFFQISIGMLGTVASQVRPQMARCINDWYYKSQETQRQRHEELLKIMPRYAKYNPSAFMLGVIESVCGKIKK